MAENDAPIDERQMTPAMQRTLDKVMKELKVKVGDKSAQAILQKYMDQDEKDK